MKRDGIKSGKSVAIGRRFGLDALVKQSQDFHLRERSACPA